jgi:hypothetical protein
MHVGEWRHLMQTWRAKPTRRVYRDDVNILICKVDVVFGFDFFILTVFLRILNFTAPSTCR